MPRPPFARINNIPAMTTLPGPGTLAELTVKNYDLWIYNRIKREI
jgi:hypothetical protein